MLNILFKLYHLKIKNKHIIEEKDRFVEKLQGALEEQKLKVELLDRNNEINQILVELYASRHKINNMET
jgi:hypothetical protein